MCLSVTVLRTRKFASAVVYMHILLPCLYSQYLYIYFKMQLRVISRSSVYQDVAMMVGWFTTWVEAKICQHIVPQSG